MVGRSSRAQRCGEGLSGPAPGSRWGGPPDSCRAPGSAVRCFRGVGAAHARPVRPAFSATGLRCRLLGGLLDRDWALRAVPSRLSPSRFGLAAHAVGLGVLDEARRVALDPDAEVQQGRGPPCCVSPSSLGELIDADLLRQSGGLRSFRVVARHGRSPALSSHTLRATTPHLRSVPGDPRRLRPGVARTLGKPVDRPSAHGWVQHARRARHSHAPRPGRPGPMRSSARPAAGRCRTSWGRRGTPGSRRQVRCQGYASVSRRPPPAPSLVTGHRRGRVPRRHRSWRCARVAPAPRLGSGGSASAIGIARPAVRPAPSASAARPRRRGRRALHLGADHLLGRTTASPPSAGCHTSSPLSSSTHSPSAHSCRRSRPPPRPAGSRS